MSLRCNIFSSKKDFLCDSTESDTIALRNLGMPTPLSTVFTHEKSKKERPILSQVSMSNFVHCMLSFIAHTLNNTKLINSVKCVSKSSTFSDQSLKTCSNLSANCQCFRVNDYFLKWTNFDMLASEQLSLSSFTKKCLIIDAFFGDYLAIPKFQIYQIKISILAILYFINYRESLVIIDGSSKCKITPFRFTSIIWQEAT